MSPSSPEAFQVSLDNCDREPIHIPGRIQSHGVLVAFGDTGTVTHLSGNAQAILGDAAPALGQSLTDTLFARRPEMLLAAQECLAADGLDVQPIALEVDIGGQPMEMVAHRVGARVIIELEPLPDDAERFDDHAFKGHRALQGLRRQRTIEDLLETAVHEVRRLTGFDRVMAYRFRHDDSGDVVAEARIDALEPFAGRRYPASDIPAQARRLYVLSTLRNIVDVASPTVEVLAAAGQGEPLDMSYSVLRGVSPVHIEYLGNMGVRASMSISIVIHGALWGMIACHHTQPHVVPYRVRSACDVLAQVLAANIQGLAARAHAARMESAATVRAQAVEHVLHAEEGIFALHSRAQDVCDMFEAQGLALSEQGRLLTHGGVPAGAARALVGWLQAQADDSRALLIQRHALDDLPEPLREQLGVWCGFLAVRFGAASQGWLVLLRKEQVETIAWGGRPEKEYVHGPMGARLTPRGSFDVWKQTVRGQSVPWNAADLEIAQSLLADLVRAASVRGADVERARSHLLSMLGAVSDGGGVAAPGGTAAQPPGRTQYLVSQVLDASRLQSGAGLALRSDEVDFAALVAELVDEAVAAHAGTRFIRELPASALVTGDAQRLRQAVQGLIANARVHGAPDEPVLVQLQRTGDVLSLDVSNAAEDVSAETAEALFDPFGRPAAVLRTGGLGLGLYIGRSIARAHGGDLAYSYADPYVVFTLTLPVRQPEA